MIASGEDIFRSAQRVLIIKLGGIGDVLLASPVFEQLKKLFPSIHLSVLTEHFAADVVRGNPWVDGILTFNKKEDSGIGLIKKVRGGKFDAVIDLFCNPRTALVTRLSGARHRIGYPFRGRGYAYTVRIESKSGEMHNVDFNREVLRQLNFSAGNAEPYFPIDETSKEFASQWIEKEGIREKMRVALSPSGGWPTKRWRNDQFAELADAIADRYHAEIVIMWGPGEADTAEKIQSMMKRPSRRIPKTTLKELGALLGEMNYVIANDSGPMHIAAAVGVPTLGIFGPTDPKFQGPYGEYHHWVRNEELDCLGCNLMKCPIRNICMTQLPPSKVLRAFDMLMTIDKTRI